MAFFLHVRTDGIKQILAPRLREGTLLECYHHERVACQTPCRRLSVIAARQSAASAGRRPVGRPANIPADADWKSAQLEISRPLPKSQSGVVASLCPRTQHPRD